MDGQLQLDGMVRTPQAILESALSDDRIAHVVALTSGGGDSTAAMIAARDVLDFAVFIDTGTSLPGVEEHAQRVCDTLGIELRVYRTPRAEYESIVLKHGFPGPRQHGIAYRRLKERRLEQLLRDIKQHRRERVAFTTGVRRQESIIRMGRVREVSRRRAMVWVAPILDWSAGEVRDAREAHGIGQSDVSALLHRSGECNCGAMASRGERDELFQFFPEWAEYAEWLERELDERGTVDPRLRRWGHGLRIGRDTTAGLMCTDCPSKLFDAEAVP